MSLINSTNLPIQDVMPLLFNQWHLRDTNSGYGNKPTPNIAYGLYDFATATEDTDNVVFTVSNCSGNFWNNEARFYSNVTKVGFNMALQTGKRACVVRYTSDLGDGNTIYSWLLLCKDNSTIVTTSRYTPYGTSTPSKWGSCRLDGNRSQGDYSFDISNSSMSTYGYNNATHTVDLTISNDANITNFYNDCYVVDGEKQYFNTILKHNYNYAWSYKHNGDATHVGFPNYLTAGETARYIFSIEKLPDFLPVFDVADTSAIISYLDTGDDGGKSIDPFDPNNPKIVTITDYKTDFTLYLTKGNNATHFSATATNAQFVSARDVLADDYAMYVGAGVTTLDKMRTPTGQQTLTKSWSHNITQTNGITDYNVLLCFGDSIPVSEWDLSRPENTSGYFTVGLKYKQSSEVGCGVATVSFKTSATGTVSHPTRTAITDGYLYTASTGEKLKVLFRAITEDDLKDINDEGYDNESDTEDTSTGTTATEVCGHGLGTYKVSQAGFDAINDALWSTDWTQLFKSNTIDPVKCVISCKGIPFEHSGTATDAVYIANQRIVCSAGKCNPVNTYNIGSYTIQAINNNFTDMTMTKVRVYLPYIAWVELPAEEVISRVGRAEVGLTSVTKVLNFKYIVDFVDGSCRCVISVNGTERWFFDGNCGVDIPVTSDNHTSAISNAIKSGVQTVMNVGLAVGSLYAGNAMGVASGITGAIGSLSNTIPTYNYSATANSSGYINHSMGNKIVIVIESPNVQMPNGYGHKYGFPCMRNLTLGCLSGYTKCDNVDLSGINGTNYELNYIKSALESGVYL